jgi:hypothetical protein
MNHLAKLYHMHTNTNASAELDSWEVSKPALQLENLVF